MPPSGVAGASPSSASTSTSGSVPAPATRRVLCLYTGGTIGMRRNFDGVNEPVAGFLGDLLEAWPQLNDRRHHGGAPHPSTPDGRDAAGQAAAPFPRYHPPPAGNAGAADSPARGAPTYLLSPVLHSLGDARISLTLVEYRPLLDSSNFTHFTWQDLARDVARNYESFDGFIILHGTDTMAFTASALGFFLENLGKPVILTGSQIPMEEQRSDGFMIREERLLEELALQVRSR
eukprot:g9921.t1